MVQVGLKTKLDNFELKIGVFLFGVPTTIRCDATVSFFITYCNI